MSTEPNKPRGRVLQFVQGLNIGFPNHSNEIDQEVTDKFMALLTSERQQWVEEARKEAIYDALNRVEWQAFDQRTTEVKKLRDAIWKIFKKS